MSPSGITNYRNDIHIYNSYKMILELVALPNLKKSFFWLFQVCNQKITLHASSLYLPMPPRRIRQFLSIFNILKIETLCAEKMYSWWHSFFNEFENVISRSKLELVWYNELRPHFLLSKAIITLLMCRVTKLSVIASIYLLKKSTMFWNTRRASHLMNQRNVILPDIWKWFLR